MDLLSKYDLIEKIVQTNDEQVLWQIKHLLEEDQAESWEDLDVDLKESLNIALEQSRKGMRTPHSQVMAGLKRKYAKK